MRNSTPVCKTTTIGIDQHEWHVDSIENLLHELNNLTEFITSIRSDPLILFRGQSDAKWVLDSKFVRSCKKLLFGGEAEKPLNPTILNSVEYHQVLVSLLLFKQRIWYPSKELIDVCIRMGSDPLFHMHRRIQQYPEEDGPLQLKGSPFIDWTNNYDVAIYFMNEDRNDNGAIYICNASATGKTLHFDYGKLIDRIVESTNEGKASGCPLLVIPKKQIYDERVMKQEAVYWVQMDLRFNIEYIWSKQEKELDSEFIYKKLTKKRYTKRS